MRFLFFLRRMTVCFFIKSNKEREVGKACGVRRLGNVVFAALEFVSGVRQTNGVAIIDGGLRGVFPKQLAKVGFAHMAERGVISDRFILLGMLGEGAKCGVQFFELRGRLMVSLVDAP